MEAVLNKQIQNKVTWLFVCLFITALTVSAKADQGDHVGISMESDPPQSNERHSFGSSKKRHVLCGYDTQDHQLSMVNTVKDTSEGYSQRQVQLAKAAREFQAKVGHPSTNDLKKYRQEQFDLELPCLSS